MSAAFFTGMGPSALFAKFVAVLLPSNGDKKKSSIDGNRFGGIVGASQQYCRTLLCLSNFYLHGVFEMNRPVIRAIA